MAKIVIDTGKGCYMEVSGDTNVYLSRPDAAVNPPSLPQCPEKYWKVVQGPVTRTANGKISKGTVVEMTAEERAAVDFIPYDELRRQEFKRQFPDVGDQLDAIMKGFNDLRAALRGMGIELPRETSEWVDKCLEIKAKYPKPEREG
jgi:hypothetical protein